MNEELYGEIIKTIESYKYGANILRIINNITTSLVYIVHPIFLLVLGVNGDSRFWKVLLVPGISFVLLSVFRNYINASRPYEIYNIIPIINKDSKGKSFPSRHVFSVFVISMTLYFISAPVGISLFLIGIIIGLVRVLGGVHFPRDVIAGALLGILFSLIGWNFNFF